eukprot:TRINITY_DN38727_c0_g1_i1.p1 TRINITY_DN38727_c0_g1~~TRINITY_DN38727_c0_g1_i1.p1  ORF type:complete len:251 (-),score=46.46 TRINITY_DN38727_c0_g1_i1:17-769(-)
MGACACIGPGGREDDPKVYFPNHPHSALINAHLARLRDNSTYLDLQQCSVLPGTLLDVMPCALLHDGALWPGFLWVTASEIAFQGPIHAKQHTIIVDLTAVRTARRCCIGMDNLGVCVRTARGGVRCELGRMDGLSFFEFGATMERDMLFSLLEALRGVSSPLSQCGRRSQEDQLPELGHTKSDVCELSANTLVCANRFSALGHQPVSYTHLRAHETVLDLVCRLLLEKKKKKQKAIRKINDQGATNKLV